MASLAASLSFPFLKNSVVSESFFFPFPQLLLSLQSLCIGLRVMILTAIKVISRNELADSAGAATEMSSELIIHLVDH